MTDTQPVPRFLRGIRGYVDTAASSKDTRDSSRSSRDHARKIGCENFDETDISLVSSLEKFQPYIARFCWNVPSPIVSGTLGFSFEMYFFGINGKTYRYLR